MVVCVEEGEERNWFLENLPTFGPTRCFVTASPIICTCSPIILSWSLTRKKAPEFSHLSAYFLVGVLSSSQPIFSFDLGTVHIYYRSFSTLRQKYLISKCC